MWVCLLASFFNLFPVHLKLLACSNYGAVCDNNRIIKIFLHQNDLAILIELVINLLRLFFLLCLLVSLSFRRGICFFWERFVTSASNRISLQLDKSRVFASSLDVFYFPLVCLDIVAVEEVSKSYVAILGCLNLFSKEFVFFQVFIREVILDLSLYFSVINHEVK